MNRRKSPTKGFPRVPRTQTGRATRQALAELQAATDRRFMELAAIIKADVRDLFDCDGKLKRIQDLPEIVRLAIADCDVEPTTGRIRRFRFKDKVDAAEKYLRMLGEADKPEIVALLKAARRQQQRMAAIMKAANDRTERPEALN